jgi:hypothetical protein
MHLGTGCRAAPAGGMAVPRCVDSSDIGLLQICWCDSDPKMRLGTPRDGTADFIMIPRSTTTSSFEDRPICVNIHAHFNSASTLPYDNISTQDSQYSDRSSGTQPSFVVRIISNTINHRGQHGYQSQTSAASPATSHKLSQQHVQ